MRKFSPLSDGHPSIGQVCYFCDEPLKAGDVPTLVVRRPADNEEDAKARAGRAYNAIAEVAHYDCAMREAHRAETGADG